jgi:hypothetical protein
MGKQFGDIAKTFPDQTRAGLEICPCITDMCMPRQFIKKLLALPDVINPPAPMPPS